MSVLRRRLAKLSDKDIAEIKGADYAAIMEGLDRSGMSGAAEEFRSRCRAFLAFCVIKAKVLDANPLYGYRRQRDTRADRLARAAPRPSPIRYGTRHGVAGGNPCDLPASFSSTWR